MSLGREPGADADARAGEILDVLALLPLDPGLLEAAGALTEPALRALDAIHVAAAADLSPLDAFVSYDERQAGRATRRPAHRQTRHLIAATCACRPSRARR